MSDPVVFQTIKAVRDGLKEIRSTGKTIALVPTMGALHEGHLSLVRFAQTHADYVLVSIFVNPTQFGEGEDFDQYPRTWDSDIAALASLKTDGVFAPTSDKLYPSGFATEVSVAGPAKDLETTHRPHFFSGVATIVSKLLLCTLPDVAIFGEKDYQQLLVIKTMAADLNIPVTIIGAPTEREADGLALSSRNVYLSSAERARAPLLHQFLQECAENLKHGMPSDEAVDQARRALEGNGFDIDYVAYRNADTLAPITDDRSEPGRLLAAARLGTTRLIDNIAV